MSFYLERTMCDVLSEMRTCYKTYNFAILSSLIEEAQIMANRMESKIETINNYEEMQEKFKTLRKKYKKLYNKTSDD